MTNNTDNLKKWESFSFSFQMANLMGEFKRGYSAYKQNKKESCIKQILKCLSFLELIKNDPKNINKMKELEMLQIIILDWINDNIYDTDPEKILKYLTQNAENSVYHNR